MAALITVLIVLMIAFSLTTAIANYMEMERLSTVASVGALFSWLVLACSAIYLIWM